MEKCKQNYLAGKRLPLKWYVNRKILFTSFVYVLFTHKPFIISTLYQCKYCKQ